MGTVEGSTLEDWPISYADLEPYYEKAEWEIGVSGDDSNNIYRSPRRRPLPMPPLSPNREYEILKPAAQRLGTSSLRHSHASQFRSLNGACGMYAVPLVRGVCVRSGREEWHAEHGHPRGSGHGELRAAQRMHRQRDSNQCARPSDGRRLLRLRVATPGADSGCGRGFGLSQRIGAPAAQFEEPIISERVGQSLRLGRKKLQGHAYTGATGLFDSETYDDLGPGASIAICDFNHGNKGLIGGGMLANEFIRLPYQFVGRRGPGVPKWGRAHKQFMRQWYRRSVMVMGPVQEMPVFESRVQVDPKVRDYWGIPVARLSGHRHPNDHVVAQFLASKAEAWLKEAGATTTWTSLPDAGLSGGQHQAGTCRMGDDPKTSVVDKYCRVHDVENLFVVDGSVHVTNGGFNPALTIMAIAYYASDNLVKSWRGTHASS